MVFFPILPAFLIVSIDTHDDDDGMENTYSEIRTMNIRFRYGLGTNCFYCLLNGVIFNISISRRLRRRRGKKGMKTGVRFRFRLLAACCLLPGFCCWRKTQRRRVVPFCSVRLEFGRVYFATLFVCSRYLYTLITYTSRRVVYLNL